MTKIGICPCVASAPSLLPETLQRRRIATLVNVSPAVAAVLAWHAYGRPSETVVLIAEAGTLAGGGCR